MFSLLFFVVVGSEPRSESGKEKNPDLGSAHYQNLEFFFWVVFL
jgi:hypothetical protein